MAIRSRHGNARNHGTGPVVETLPVDELPAFIPDVNPPAEPARDAQGRYVAGRAETIEAARRAGQARRNQTRLACTLGVASKDPVWAALLRQAEAYRRAQVKRLASHVGGGECGPGPASLVASAALALAGSRLSYQRGDLTAGARLAAESRQALLAAHELAAREAQARPLDAKSEFPWMALPGKGGPNP